MHYHYHPQEPGDGRNAYCFEHVPTPDFETGMVYVCDCEGHNICCVCEEIAFQPVCIICRSVVTENQMQVSTTTWTAHMECVLMRYGRSSTYGKVENP